MKYTKYSFQYFIRRKPATSGHQWRLLTKHHGSEDLNVVVLVSKRPGGYRFISEDGGSTFLRNVGICIQVLMTL
jgi:hypothetical protein